MSKSKRVSVEDNMREKRDVLIFAIDELLRDPEEKTHMSEIYDSYKSWRKRMGYGPTLHSVDGFGRLFPANFKRETFYKNGIVARGLMGISIRIRN